MNYVAFFFALDKKLWIIQNSGIVWDHLSHHIIKLKEKK